MKKLLVFLAAVAFLFSAGATVSVQADSDYMDLPETYVPVPR